MGPLKTCVAQERREERLKKEITKSDVGGGVAAKKVILLTHKNEILRVTYFVNDPYDADLYCCIFMSAFVDDVISDF